MTHPDWIAVDWSDTHLRLWQMTDDGQVLARAEAEGQPGGEGLGPALRALLPGLARPVPVLVCGAAGGGVKTPGLRVPCKPPSVAQALPVEAGDPLLQISLLPGVAQDRPADLMHGEVTQVAGFLALNPRFDGVICVPGRHSRWIHVSAGEIVSFRSFLTGELFALLSERSVLRDAIDETWAGEVFAEAVDQAMSRPAGVAAELFGLHAGHLLHGLAPGVARARLSGLLIGIELAAARVYWLGQSVALLGTDALAGHYRDALAAQGVPAVMADAERMTLEGLKAARRPEAPE